MASPGQLATSIVIQGILHDYYSPIPNDDDVILRMRIKKSGVYKILSCPIKGELLGDTDNVATVLWRKSELLAWCRKVAGK